MERKSKLVVFDLDGTLNRTELYAVPAHRKALLELGFADKTDDEIISTFGARAQEAVVFLTGNSDPDFAKQYFRQEGLYENDFIKEHAAAYDGVPQMLEQLKQNHYQTAICSNSSERYIRMVLTRLDILRYIDHIQPLQPDMHKGDTLRLLINRVQPESAVMVGDRFYDKDAARDNGIPFIGCSYGFRPDEVSDADIPVKSALDINAAVKKLIG